MSKFSEKLKAIYGKAEETIREADELRKGCNPGRTPSENEEALRDVGQIPTDDQQVL